MCSKNDTCKHPEGSLWNWWEKWLISRWNLDNSLWGTPQNSLWTSREGMHPHKWSRSNQAQVTIYHRHRCLKSPIIMYGKWLCLVSKGQEIWWPNNDGNWWSTFLLVSPMNSSFSNLFFLFYWPFPSSSISIPVLTKKSCLEGCMEKRARMKLFLLIGYTYRMKRKKTLSYFVYLHTLGFKLTECMLYIHIPRATVRP